MSISKHIEEHAILGVTSGGGGGGGGGPTNWGSIGGTLGYQADLAAALAQKENSLANPSVSGHVLSSTTAGVRSWVAQPSPGGSNTHVQRNIGGAFGGSSDLTFDAGVLGLSAATNTKLSLRLAGAELGSVRLGTDSTVLAAGVSRHLRLLAGDVERVTVLNNGNVGIGTMAPGSRLTVNGDSNVTGWQIGPGYKEYTFLFVCGDASGRLDILDFSYNTAEWHHSGIDVEVIKYYFGQPQKTVFFLKQPHQSGSNYEVVYGGGIVGYWHSETVISGTFKKATFAINCINYHAYAVKVRVPSDYGVVSSITGWPQVSIINSFNSTIYATTNTGSTLFGISGGNVGIGTTTPTAALHIRPGTATAGTAPLKLTAGTNLTVPENGAIEFNGTDFFVTSGGNRRAIQTTTYNLLATETFAGYSINNKQVFARYVSGTTPTNASTDLFTLSAAARLVKIEGSIQRNDGQWFPASGVPATNNISHYSVIDMSSVGVVRMQMSNAAFNNQPYKIVVFYTKD